MGIGSVLDRALGGMLATQLAVDITARNIANAGTPGYTRKVHHGIDLTTGGVLSNPTTRQLDAVLQRQLRLERSGAAYADTTATYLDRVDLLFGQPGGPNTLDTRFNAFTQSVQALTTSPNDYLARADVLRAGQTLASTLNNLSENVQSLRREAERGIADAVSQANDALRRLEGLNRQVIERFGTPSMTPDLLDERDRAIDDLSRLMDIRVVEGDHGGVSVFTQSGVLLFDKTAARIDFDERPNLDAHSVYDPDPAERGVGTLTLVSPNGSRLDLLRDRAIRSGELAALVDMRDRALVETQNQLDMLAEGLARSLSDRDVAGVAASGPSPAGDGFDLDVSGLQPGDTIHLSFTQGGTTRKVSIIRVDDPAMLPLPDSATAETDDVVIGVDFSGGAGPAASGIQAGLVGRFGAAVAAAVTVTGAGSTLQVRDDGAPGTSDIGRFDATVTNTALTGAGPSLPFFTDGKASGSAYTGHFEGKSQRIGFAGRISVNPALAADQSKLVLHASTTPAGDATRPKEILRRLTETTAAYGIDSDSSVPFRGTLDSLTQAIVSRQGARASFAARVRDGQEIVVNALQDRFDRTSGVNIDEELADLVNLQNAFAANARVMQAAQEMMDALFNIA